MTNLRGLLQSGWTTVIRNARPEHFGSKDPKNIGGICTIAEMHNYEEIKKIKQDSF